MADAPQSGGRSNGRKIALVAGLGLIGVGAYQLTKGSKPAPAGPLPATSGKRLTFAGWLGVCRPDVVGGVQQGRYGDVLGQYLKEQWVDYLSRRDVIGKPASSPDVLGEWLKENAPGFWGRPDVQMGKVQGRWNDIWGQFVRENGGFGCLPTGLAPTGSGGLGVAPTVKPPPVSNPLALLPGMVIATSCQLGVANYVVDTRGAPLLGVPTNLVKRWIADQASWNALRVPRSCIRIVTAGVIQYLPNGAQLQIALDVTQGLPGVQRWAFGAPPSSLYSQSAGYCG